MKKPKFEKRQIQFRKIKDIDMKVFQEDISSSDLLSPIFSSLSLNDMASTYDNTLSTILDNHAPLLTQTIQLRRDSPWYNSTLHNMKQNKRRLENTFTRTKSDADYNKYKEYCRPIYITALEISTDKITVK